MRKLSSYPTLHHFITRFVYVYMFDERKSYEGVLDELSHYKIVSFCKCGECGTVELEAPNRENIFSIYEKGMTERDILLVNLNEVIVFPKTLDDTKYIDFEVANSYWSGDSVPYWREITSSSPNSNGAKEIVKKYFTKNMKILEKNERDSNAILQSEN